MNRNSGPPNFIIMLKSSLCLSFGTASRPSRQNTAPFLSLSISWDRSRRSPTGSVTVQSACIYGLFQYLERLCMVRARLAFPTPSSPVMSMGCSEKQKASAVRMVSWVYISFCRRKPSLLRDSLKFLTSTPSLGTSSLIAILSMNRVLYFSPLSSEIMPKLIYSTSVSLVTMKL